MTRILALDQSTSATKAVLFDDNGRIIAKASRDHRQIYPKPGWVEHDPEEIWRNTLAVLREVTEKNPGLAALSITNQRETVLVFDRKTGAPLHHAIVWQCRRGDAICQALKSAGHDDLVESKTGLKIDTYFSASKIRWLIEQNPLLAEKLRSGDALVGTIDTYLIHRLTGGAVFATDFTNASRTLLFDIRALQWDPELCQIFGVPMAALPEVRESAAHFGTTNAGGILSDPIPIIGVMGDSQASLFAQRCHQPGSAKATFGTGTSVMLNIGDQFLSSRNGVVTALAWVRQSRPTYALEGLINFSAATISWLKDHLGLIRDATETEALARLVEDNGGVYFVPAFAGLGAPYWNSEARAAILGMTAHTTKAHIVRAALEAIAYQIRDVLDLMRDESGVNLIILHADGGATRNDFLMQFTADITGLELTVSEVAESSAWGAAMSGFLGLGRDLDDLSQLASEQRSFHPSLDAATVAVCRKGWTDAVKRVL